MTADASPHDSTHTRLAKQIVERRKRLQLTQQDLADLSDVSVRFVVSLEQGKATIRLSGLVSVLEALGLELSASPRNP